jgi:hypothetical protein
MSQQPQSRVPATVIDWLLEPDNPTVRYLTLTELLGRPESHPEVREACASIMRVGVVPEILKLQAPEGYWARPESFYADKYRGTVWRLIVLAEYRADGRDPRVQQACEFILAHSQDPASGGFSMKGAKRTPGGLPSEVIPCLTGNMVWSLARLGRLGDLRVQRGVDWLTRFLRFDDSDSAPGPDFPYSRWEMCYGRHSCLMGVVKGLKALAEIPEEERSPAVRRTIGAGVEFLLRHHVYKRSHDLARVAKPGWTRFGFPRMYQTDVLEVGSILVGLGCRDEGLHEALALIVSKRRPDGRWLLQDKVSGKLQVGVERRGEPSKWITLRALRTLVDAGAISLDSVLRARTE